VGTRITITNRGGWVGVDAAERQFVEAEIVATQDEFIAVFETQPGVDDAPLGIVWSGAYPPDERSEGRCGADNYGCRNHRRQ
jgi:hypothetical protein